MKIDINKVIDRTGLDIKEVARELFPGSGYPDSALKRVIDGRQKLYIDQAAKLANMAGISVDEMLNSKGWRIEGGLTGLQLTRNGYRALFNHHNGELRIFDRDTTKYETLYVVDIVTVSEFLNKIDGVINNFK